LPSIRAGSTARTMAGRPSTTGIITSVWCSALRNGAPFADPPESFRRLQTQLLPRSGGDREMVEILALVLLYDEQAVLTAVELALEAHAPSKPHVLNLLARLVGQTPPAPVDAPPSLALRVEPVANVARYDGLRRTRHVA
jgi:hypothetical protein